ncbi:MAG: beta-N-acetylhexosaminidase [Bacteroidales bacterium]
MNKILKYAATFLILVSANSFFLFSTEMNGQSKTSIIPQPQKMVSHSGGFFNLDGSAKIVVTDPSLEPSARFLSGYLKRYYGLEINTEVVKGIKGVKKGKSAIVLALTPDGAGRVASGSFDPGNPAGSVAESGYRLKVSDAGAVLEGDGRQGLFYAVQSLIQLLPVPESLTGVVSVGKKASEVPVASRGEGVRVKSLSVPFAEVEDAPRFEYRGMHLDVVRHIWSVDYIKQYIDYLALHKMNYFHIHLTDDQAYRIESKKYPKLNSIGSWRAGTIIGVFPGTGVDSTRYGGFYTAEQLRDIVNYASERYITVVPEIDVPGHSMAIISSYPQFSTTPEIPKQPAITWGIYNRQNNVLAPSDELFVFLRDIFNELMDIFPSKLIHIGADECAKRWWEESESTKQYMRERGIADFNMLQKHFVEKLSAVMSERGRVIVGWDEMIDDGLVPGSVVMSWRNATNGYKAAEQGHKTILAPMRQSYFNIKQRDREDSLSHRDWKVGLADVYNFEPVPEELSSESASNILGGQGCMWTEYFPHRQRLEYGIFPRLSAIAEVYWSLPSVRNLENFVERLQKQYARYDLWGANYYAGDRIR